MQEKKEQTKIQDKSEQETEKDLGICSAIEDVRKEMDQNNIQEKSDETKKTSQALKITEIQHENHQDKNDNEANTVHEIESQVPEFTEDNINSDDDKPLSVLKCPREEQTDIYDKMETKKQETLEDSKITNTVQEKNEQTEVQGNSDLEISSANEEVQKEIDQSNTQKSDDEIEKTSQDFKITETQDVNDQDENDKENENVIPESTEDIINSDDENPREEQIDIHDKMETTKQEALQDSTIMNKMQEMKEQTEMQDKSEQETEKDLDTEVNTYHFPSKTHTSAKYLQQPEAQNRLQSKECKK